MNTMAQEHLAEVKANARLQARLAEAERLLRGIASHIRWDTPAPKGPDPLWNLCQDTKAFLSAASASGVDE